MVMVEAAGNGVTPNAPAVSDLADDLAVFQAAQDAGDEAIETTASITTTASLGAAMSAGMVGQRALVVHLTRGGSVSEEHYP